MIGTKLNRAPSSGTASIDKALKTCADARAALEALNSDDGGPAIVNAKVMFDAAERALNSKMVEDIALRRVGRSVPDDEIANLQRERDNAKAALDEAQRFADGREMAREALRAELSTAHERLSAAVVEATASLRREAETNFVAAVEQLRDTIHVLDQLEDQFRAHKVKLPDLGRPHLWGSTKPSPEIVARLEPFLPALRERDISLARLLR